MPKGEELGLSQKQSAAAGAQSEGQPPLHNRRKSVERGDKESPPRQLVPRRATDRNTPTGAGTQSMMGSHLASANGHKQ